MANTSAALLRLLDLKAQINMYTQQDSYWSQKNEANAKILTKQQGYLSKFENAYDNAADETRSTDLKMGENIFLAKNVAGNDSQCTQWAHYKVKQYDEALLEECEQLDIEYDTITQMFETLLQELRAEEESQSQVVSEDAQDTNLVNP